MNKVVFFYNTISNFLAFEKTCGRNAAFPLYCNTCVCSGGCTINVRDRNFYDENMD